MVRQIQKIVDAIYGGLAVYEEARDLFRLTHCAPNLRRLLEAGVQEGAGEADDVLTLLCDEDQPRVAQALAVAREAQQDIKVYFPLRQRDASGQIWCQMDGWAEEGSYFLLLFGLTPECQLFQRMAGETQGHVYVIDRENYDLLYGNDQTRAYWITDQSKNKKCYQALCGETAPCAHCTLTSRPPDGVPHEICYHEKGRYYTTRFREIDWNGTPAYVKYVQDHTEVVRSQQEKEHLEQYFQTVLQNLPGGVAVVRWTADGSLRPEYLSNGLARMLGMSVEEAWNQYRDDALCGVHPEDQERVREGLTNCIQEDRGRTELQYRLRSGTGGDIWVSTCFSVLRVDDGETMIYADYHDITAEKQRQEQQRRHYKEKIFQHYLVTDPNTLILGHCNITQNKILEIVDHTNSDLIQRFGSEREGFFMGLGTLISDLEERQQFYDRYLNEPSDQAYRQGITEVLLPCYLTLSPDQPGRYVQFKVNLVETPDTGDITGILTVTDITEETIRDKILLHLTSINYDLVADIDLINDHYEIVGGGDECLTETSGCSSQRAHRLAELLVTEAEKEQVLAKLDTPQVRRLLQEKSSYFLTYAIRDDSGSVRTKRMMVSAIDLRLGRACFVRTDMTEVLAAERKTQYALEQALAEAEKASRVKSEFLSSMSHDIRTPMNAIVGTTTLALANLDDRDKVQDYLRKISTASQHLLSLINDILDMSKIEQSKIQLASSPIHMEELVDNIASILGSQAKTAGLTFRIEAGPFAHPCFLGDTLRIKQILLNLLGNAFKFTLEGGTVRFAVEEIPALDPSRYRYRFTVQDTGVGMSEEFMEHLFEPFLRSEAVHKVEGTGLGLSITKGLVDLMGGTIQVQSRQNEGTTFQVELEFVPSSPQERTAASQKADPGTGDLHGYHFLLVEDNAINAEILCELLKMRGATFQLQENGLQAVEAFRNAKPGTFDAILMDIQMPVMNGYEATRAIRSLDHPDAQKIVIIAMTADAFAEDVQEALAAGMNAHLSKPVDLNLLCRTIKELL